MEPFGQTTLGEQQVRLPAGRVTLEGDLAVPRGAAGVVVFAHGSGSSRRSPRNRKVARALQQGGLGTLLLDLLTPAEEAVDARSGHLRFDLALLADRLVSAWEWLARGADTRHLRVGYFGASTGGGAALWAAAAQPEEVFAVVARGGRPDLAGSALPWVRAPTLLVVGEHDEVVLALNQQALTQLRCEKQLAVVPGATHLFEEPGALEAVAELARAWFQRHLRPGAPPPQPP